MKIFLSWSGARSREVASALRDWLPDILQVLDPWVSGADISAGARWASELELQLQEARVGIICLTPENVASSWLLFEAGALSRSLDTAYVVPYLFGFSPNELHGPLVQFQAVQATEEGTWSLVHSLNRALGDLAVSEGRLRRAFDRVWPHLEAAFTAAEQLLPAEESPAVPITHQLDESLQKVIRGLTPPAISQEPTKSTRAPRVFVIHGHNIAIRETVARFIEHLGPAVVVLSEQPDRGRTIIEKFESLSDVDYAVAIMSADDIGGTKSSAGDQALQSRARQNVVFELGFFAAKLGRSRIAVLFEDGVELPSDFSGILYISIDIAGAWKFALARELKVAGLPVDLNNAL